MVIIRHSIRTKCEGFAKRTHSRRLAFSMFLTSLLTRVASSTSPKKPMAMIERALKAVGQIRNTTTLVVERAKAGGVTPLAGAEELVAERLARATERWSSSNPPLAQTIRNLVTRKGVKPSTRRRPRSFVASGEPCRVLHPTSDRLCTQRFPRSHRSGAGRPIGVLVRRTGWWRYLKTATPACQSVADVKVAVAF
jgi:hypothetical protein